MTPWDDLDWAGPELSQQSRLEPGKILGLRFTLWDVDDPDPLRLDGAFFYPEPVEEVGAHTFADGLLIPCGLPGCSRAETGIEPDSWGRIKASLR